MKTRWGKILLKDSSDGVPERNDITRWYHKGGCLCWEVAELAPDGNPLVYEFPHESYTYAQKSHMPHPGMEPRGESSEGD